MLTWFPHRQTEGRHRRPEGEIILNPSVNFRRTYRLAILTMFPAGIVQETCWLLSHVSYYVDGNIPHYPMSYPFVILIHGYTAS